MRVSATLMAACTVLLAFASPSIANPLAQPAKNGLEARQSSSLHLFVVDSADQKLGPLFVTTTGTAQVNPPTSPSTQSFQIDPTTSFLVVAFPSPQSPPHAFISFANSGTSCGSSGPLVFATSNSNKCSQQPGWEVTSDNEVVPTSVVGGFEMCEGSSQIGFTKLTPGEGCTTIKLVTQDWIA